MRRMQAMPQRGRAEYPATAACARAWHQYPLRQTDEAGLTDRAAFSYDSHSIRLPPTRTVGDGFCHNEFVVRIFLRLLHCEKSRTPPMASELIKHISDSSFESDVLQPGTTVLVDYWAEWCGPCKMIAPILDEAAQTYKDKLSIAKMNVDENREIPAKFGIRGIPTLMLFKDGQLAATKVGALNKAQLSAFLDQHLA
jgi:thioredoxin 1